MGTFSLLTVASRLASAFRRFPLAAVFFAVLTGCALYSGHNDLESRTLFLVLYYPATAAVLNIVLRLLEESGTDRRCGMAGYIPDIVVNCLWLAIALVYRGAFPLSVSWAVSAAALAAALFLLIFLIPFSWRNPDDLGFWNHTVDTAMAMLISLISGGILAGGLSLLLLAFEMLFDLEIGWKLYRDVTVVSFALIAPLVFLQSCPEPAGERLSRADRPGRLLKKLNVGDSLIVTEISRLSRSLTEIMGIMGECLEKRICLYTTKERYTFDDSINSKVLCFAFGLVAEIERNLISMRTKEALALKRAEGVQLGRRAGSDVKMQLIKENVSRINAMLNAGMTVTKMCRRIGISRNTWYRYTKTEIVKERPAESKPETALIWNTSES